MWMAAELRSHACVQQALLPTEPIPSFRVSEFIRILVIDASNEKREKKRKRGEEEGMEECARETEKFNLNENGFMCCSVYVGTVKKQTSLEVITHAFKPSNAEAEAEAK